MFLNTSGATPTLILPQSRLLSDGAWAVSEYDGDNKEARKR